MAYQEYHAIDDYGNRLQKQGLRIEKRGRKFRALALSPRAGNVLNPGAPWVGSRARALAELAKKYPDAAKLG